MGVLLVAIAGPSSSGKTTVTDALHKLLPKSTVVHLDDFYLPDSQIPIDEASNVANWDCAEAIDWEKFSKYIHDLRELDGAILPVKPLEMEVSLNLSAEERKKAQKKADELLSQLKDTRLIFIDGFMLFHDANITRLFDKKLFFHAPYEVLKTRRESRPPYQTIEGTWVDPPNYFRDIVWPAYQDTHKNLFVDEDVTKELSQSAKKEGIKDILNDGTVPLFDLVSWAIENIIQ